MIFEKELVNCKRSLDEFFNESNLWREIYDLYWEIAPMKNRMKAITMMHDIRYVCVCINLDNDPVKHLSAIAFDSYVKRAMAYVAFNIMKDLPQKISDILPTMHKILSQWDKFSIVEESLNRILEKGHLYSIDLMAQPEPPKRIHFDYCKWSKLTNAFDRDATIEVLALWKQKSERIEILRKMEKEFQKYSKECSWASFYMEDKIETLRNLFMELRGQLEGDKFLVEEIKRLYEENKLLKEKISSLQGMKTRDSSLTLTRYSGMREGIKSVVEQLIVYGENFPSNQNDKAEIIKEALLAKSFNGHIPSDALTPEWKAQLMNLGRKEVGMTFQSESFFKISGNDQVNIGGNNNGQ